VRPRPLLFIPAVSSPSLQLRRYDLVIQLSEEGAALGARGMRASSRDTLRDLECDMALATALAQVGSCFATALGSAELVRHAEGPGV